MRLPELFTVASEEYEAIHSAWHKAIKTLPDFTVIHKQDWYIKESYAPDFAADDQSFLVKPNQRHFNERPFLNHYCYLFLIAGKAEDAENVLRVKASVRNFEPETNFSVITNDRRFYSFNVYYSSYPDVLSYDLLTMQKSIDRTNGNDVLFEELSNNPPSLPSLLLETIYKKDKRIVKHIGAKKFRHSVYPQRDLHTQRQILFPYRIEKP